MSDDKGGKKTGEKDKDVEKGGGEPEEKKGAGEGEKEKKVLDAGTAALIGQIIDKCASKDDDPAEDDGETTDDEDAEPVVTVDEVEVEQVKDDPRFTARVERIAVQAEHTYNQGGYRRDTLFFKIVLAGNVRVVSHVLDRLHEKEKPEVVKWLLMKGRQKTAEQVHKQAGAAGSSKKDGGMMLMAMRVVMYLIMAFVSIISSPFFYLVHSFTTSMFGQSEHRLAANIRLPLAFAAFSKDEDMMKFFLAKGANIKNSDYEGNTVFHYIADLSSESTERALEVFDCLVKFINDRDVVKTLIAKKRNSASLTALEYVSKYGSPQLLTKMLNYPGLMQHTAFEVGKEDVSFGQTETEADANDEPVDAITKLEYVDVTPYEQGDFMTLSTLLNLLSDRELTEMSKEDLALFDRVSFVGKWMSLKTRQMFLGILGFQICDIIVTVFLLILLMNGLGSDPFKSNESSVQLGVMIKEIKEQGKNASYIFKNEALEYIFTNVRNQMQRNFLAKELAIKGHEQELYGHAVRAYPEVGAFYNNSFDAFHTSLNMTPPEIVDKLFDSALAMPAFIDDIPLFATWQYLQEIIQAYSKQLFAHNPKLSHVEIGIENREFILGELNDFFDNFTMTIDGLYIQPSAAFDFMEFQMMFCVDRQYFTEENLMELDDKLSPKSDIYQSSCGYQAVMEMANDKCENLAADTVYDIIRSFTSRQGGPFGDRNLSEEIFKVIVGLAWLYIVLDIIERLAFIYTCVANHTSAGDMVLSVLSRKVPGSYTRKQINMVTYFAFIGRIIFKDNATYMSVTYGLTLEAVTEYGNFFLVIGLVFRFVMHIHALRLVPGVGHFVITTFMMGTNLIHFSAVYGAVVFIFAIIFHILIEDPDCPVKKYDGFESIGVSMFSIFKLTFGHGEFDAYYISTPVALTYTLYTVIVGLLLMNLIIAIMSATAENIMTDPWKETIWRVEWLDEALSVEFTACLMLQPFRRWLKTGYWSHKKAGFEVIEIDKEKQDYRIFIEVFHCAALEKDA